MFIFQKKLVKACLLFLFLALTGLRSAHGDVQKLPLLLRSGVYKKSGKSCAFPNNIPDKYVGTNLTWKVTGNAQIRTLYSNAAYGSSITQILRSDKTPKAVIKSVNSGEFQMKIFDQDGKFISSSHHVFFAIEKAWEQKQPKNYINSPKNTASNYRVVLPNPFNPKGRRPTDDRKAYTLYVATEPDSDKVELEIKTNLKKWSGFSRFKWRIYDPTLGSIKAEDYINSDGTATVKFPKNVSIAPYFELQVGGYGPNGMEWIASNPKFQFVVVANNAEYQRAYATLRNLVSGAWATKNRLASFLLVVFMEGTTQDNGLPEGIGSAYPTHSNAMIGDMTISPIQLRYVYDAQSYPIPVSPTHVAGAKFNDSGVATIDRLTFSYNSDPSQRIYDSTFFQRKLQKLSKDALDIEKGRTSNKIVTRGSFIINNGKLGESYRPSQEMGFKGQLINPSPSYYVRDNDLNVGIGNAHIRGRVDYICNRSNPKNYEIVQMHIVGEVVDLYDFNYESPVPAPLGATLQIGWRDPTAANPDRYRGKIYANYFNLDLWVTGPTFSAPIYNPPNYRNGD